MITLPGVQLQCYIRIIIVDVIIIIVMIMTAIFKYNNSRSIHVQQTGFKYPPAKFRLHGQKCHS